MGMKQSEFAPDHTTEGQHRAQDAAAEYEASHRSVHMDITVSRTPDGWIAYDWVARHRIYPPAGAL